MSRPIVPFDVVRLPAGLPQHGLPPGTRAVVIDVHHDPYEAFEIEVVGDDGETLFSGAVETAWVELDEPPADGDDGEEDDGGG